MEAEDAIEAEKPPFSLSGRRALVVVPAYNEAEAIGRTVRDLRRHAPWADVLVVNDGSADDTAEVARAAGRRLLDRGRGGHCADRRWQVPSAEPHDLP